MKMFYDYTGAEVEVMSTETVSKLIDLECANEGAPMLPPYPTEPVKPSHEPDITLFQVGGWYGVYVPTQEQATKLAQVLAEVESWDTEYVGGGYSTKRGVRKTKDVEITTTRVFSPEMWDKVKHEMEEYEAAKKQYDKDLKEYKDAETARQRISNDIWSVVNAARAFKTKREQYLQHISSYIDLAEGDRLTGIKFFQKAYSDWDKYLNITIQGTLAGLIEPIAYSDEYLKTNAEAA